MVPDQTQGKIEFSGLPILGTRSKWTGEWRRLGKTITQRADKRQTSFTNAVDNSKAVPSRHAHRDMDIPRRTSVAEPAG